MTDQEQRYCCSCRCHSCDCSRGRLLLTRRPRPQAMQTRPPPYSLPDRWTWSVRMVGCVRAAWRAHSECNRVAAAVSAAVMAASAARAGGCCWQQHHHGSAAGCLQLEPERRVFFLSSHQLLQLSSIEAPVGHLIQDSPRRSRHPRRRAVGMRGGEGCRRRVGEGGDGQGAGASAGGLSSSVAVVGAVGVAASGASGI